MYVIYSVLNTITRKEYVGMTSDFKTRIYQHRRFGSIGEGSCPQLYASMKKHGVDNFTFTVIEECDSIEVCRVREKQHIFERNTFKCGYNANPGGSGGDMSSYPNFIKAMKKRDYSGENNPRFGLFGKDNPKSQQLILDGVYYESITEARSKAQLIEVVLVDGKWRSAKQWN